MRSPLVEILRAKNLCDRSTVPVPDNTLDERAAKTLATKVATAPLRTDRLVE